ncbi:flagellar basal body rod protein FlgB [Bdellovibrio sp. HCB209]|uniref:flagellar basal body rod protein FlgB n=1 Tax=Bdellovibrio sp. HCB209 TaxID=3394354 RepID=UPI0039B491DC
MSDIFDKTINGLATSMRMRQLRNNVTSSNIANAETPGYHAKKMDFEEALSRSMNMDGMNSLSTSSGDHFALGGVSVAKTRPDIYENPEGAVNNDGNTVDLEKEMSALSENAIMYKTALQLINKKMAALKYAASEGR